MTTKQQPCESCGMPIEAGPYCPHCVDQDGNLQTFEERLERMSQWIRRSRAGLSRAEAESEALDAMVRMPAWRHHPTLLALRAKQE